MVVKIVGRKLSYNGRSMLVDDLINDSFYEYANSKALDYHLSKYCVNEIYGKYILDFLALDRWVSDNKPSSIDIKLADKEYSFIVEDVCKKNGIKVQGVNHWKKMTSIISFESNLLLSLFYFLYLF